MAITLPACIAFAIWTAAVPHSAGGAEHQHGVSRSQRGTPSQGEVHGVVVHQQRHRPGVIELDGAANHIGHRYGYLFGVAAEHLNAETRSPT